MRRATALEDSQLLQQPGRSIERSGVSTTRLKPTGRPWRGSGRRRALQSRPHLPGKGEMGAAAESCRAVDAEPSTRAPSPHCQTLKKLARTEEAIPFLKRRPSWCRMTQNCLTWATPCRTRAACGCYRRVSPVARLDPKLARAWCAGCAQHPKEYAGAMDCFRSALDIHRLPQAQHNLGQVLFKMGQVEEALGLFRHAARGRSGIARGRNCHDHPGKSGKRQPGHTRCATRWQNAISRHGGRSNTRRLPEGMAIVRCGSATSLRSFRITTG